MLLRGNVPTEGVEVVVLVVGTGGRTSVATDSDTFTSESKIVNELFDPSNVSHFSLPVFAKAEAASESLVRFSNEPLSAIEMEESSSGDLERGLLSTGSNGLGDGCGDKFGEDPSTTTNSTLVSEGVFTLTLLNSSNSDLGGGRGGAPSTSSNFSQLGRGEGRSK